MLIGRILSSIVAILLMIGLFMAASVVIMIVVVVLVGLGIVHWLRSKGILANKKGTFRGYGDENVEPEPADDTPVIEGEFEKVKEEHK